ncbi:MAG: 2-C-methyl-D-erythritol 4-phosphate cytidylyltransferase [Clostridia bacterium]|nr:2-C-methyl-D-erythritol 4-phosphate cytidylyltransferase [Clostridia bacterium]
MSVLTVTDTLARAVEGAASYFRHPFTSAVILAAGSGERMKDGDPARETVPKLFLPLERKPVLSYTLAVFDACEAVDEIVLVIRREDRARAEAFLEAESLEKPVRLTEGGETRQESAKAGLLAVDDKTKFVAIHDGDRPLITAEQITAVAKEAYRTGAAAAGAPSKDTVKLVQGRTVQSTPDRSKVWLAATPQIFKVEEYRAAVYEGERCGRTATDDCSLVEAVGFPVSMVDCGYENLKITTPEDLSLAEAILKLRREREGYASV